MSLSEDGPTLHSSSKLDGAATVARAAIAADPRHVLEAVGVDHEGTPARAPTEEVVSRVTDNHADVVLPRKVNAGLDVLLRCGHDHVNREISKRAWLCRVSGWPASVVGTVCPEF